MTLYDTLTTSGKVLLIVNVTSIILVNVLHFFFYQKHLSKTMILLMVLLMGTLYIELASEYFFNRNLSNLHLTHYYTTGLFILLSMIYYNQLKKFQLIVPIGVVLFSGVLIYQLIKSQIVYDVFNTFGFIVAACILICYAFFYYIEHISEKKYWDTFNVGLFLYLSGSSIIFLTLNHSEELIPWSLSLWTLNAFLVLLYQAFISITIYRFHRLQKNKNGHSSI